MNKQQFLQKELAELEKMEKALMIKKCFNDPWMFLTGYPMGNEWTPGQSKGFVWTFDADDNVNPFKRFPNKEYLWLIAKRWVEEKRLVIPKSRQMIISWLIVALHLWLFQFHKAQLIVFQSKKEIDANMLLERAKFIHDHEPAELQKLCPVKKIGGKWTYCKMEADIGGLNEYSKIIAIPQGKDILRSLTISAIYRDETAFQDKAEESYTACVPALNVNGRSTDTSSANGENFFYHLMKGEL